jgi:hypothetical protein
MAALNVIEGLRPNVMKNLVAEGIIYSKENTGRAEHGRPINTVGTTKIMEHGETAVLDAIRMNNKGKSKEEIKEHLDSLLDDLGLQIYEQYRYQQAVYYALSDLAYKQIGMLAPSTA